MYMSRGQPSAAAYKSIGQSKRWNRQPIPAGSSDYDNHVGGGVSLTAASDPDDNKVQASSGRYATNNKDEKPNTPSHDNAKSSRSNEQTDTSDGSRSVETSPTSIESADLKSSASQPVVTQPAPQRGRGKDNVTSILMDAYLDNQKRTRSATASARQHYVDDDIDDYREHGLSTAHSSPIKSVARGHVLAANIETRMDGAGQPFLNTYFQTHQSSHQASPTTDNSHHRNFQAINHDTQPLPTMNKQSPSKEAAIFPFFGKLPWQNGIRYNGGAPVFTPMANANAASKDDKQPNVTTPHRKQGFANDSAPATPYRLDRDYRFPQGNGLAAGGAADAGAMQVATVPSDGNYQHQSGQGFGFPNGGPGIEPSRQVAPLAYDAAQQPYRRQWGHPFRNGAFNNEQVGNPSEYSRPAAGFDSGDQQGQMHCFVSGDYHRSPRPEQRALPEAPRYGNGPQANHIHHDRDQQYIPYHFRHQSPPYHAAGNETPSRPMNGNYVDQVRPQNGSSAPVHGYKYGLPGSASDGSISLYQENGQPSNSMALARVEHGNYSHPTVGPMEFEIPTEEVMAQRSDMLQTLTEHGRPNLHDLMSPQVLPFIEGYKFATRPVENGVVVIRNIPYETTQAEVIAVLGKSSKILNDRQEPVHIIMDRVTSKTQDVYCEFSSQDAAIEIVNRFKKGPENGRIARLGNRVIEVELSSQKKLMATLFPSSKYSVNWERGQPDIKRNPEYPWESFKGFITEEEMVMLAKHVENPQRSLYARICPERPYECMISTLRKIPWYMADDITLKQRNSVYETCMKMIGVLAGKVKQEKSSEIKRLTPQLFDRLVASAMLCHGFSVVQKHNIATLAGLSETKCREFNQPRFPDSWRYQWTLVPKANMPIDVLEWYIAVIRTETNRIVQGLDISQRMALQGMMKDLDGYWGFFWADANFPTGRVWDNMSLAECSRLEWRAIERIITRAIQGGNIPPSYTSGSYRINPAATAGHARLTYRGY